MAEDNRVFGRLLRMLPRIAVAALLLAASGCASYKGGMATFTIAGTPYVPLNAVCAEKAIRSDYDALTRVVALTRNSSSMKFQVGRKDVLCDNRLVSLPSPVEWRKGMIVIPRELRQMLEERFLAAPDTFRISQSVKKIVIDAGHGGKDPGAIGRGGVMEKDVVLDIARKLRDLLENDGVEVVMTRSSDIFVPLEERAEIANRGAADLFLSVHANANPSRSLKGFEVYYISPKVSDSKRALSSANRESLNLDSSCFLSPTLNLKAILWDMTYAYDRRESIELSKTICRAMRSNSDTRVIGVKNANFSVLRGTTMPAVLVEVGFLSNPSEEMLIAREQYRRKLAERIKDGIRYYCEGLGGTGSLPEEEPHILVKDGR